MKDLSTLTDQELEDFFCSFDWFLSDIDGVLWNITEPIPDTQEAIKSLQAMGKKVIFVTNNTSRTLDYQIDRLKKRGFNIEKDEVVTPLLSILSYLKKVNLGDKKVFVLSMDVLKGLLTEAGFQLAELGPDRVASLEEYVIQSVEECGDVDCSYLNLQKAAFILKNPEVHFLIGATDVRFPISPKTVLIGPGIFHIILERMTGRKPLPMAKPSAYLNECIIDKYKIDDIGRVLFVGDSIPEDMGFGTISGYKKLLVLSGLSTRESIENWKHPEELKPDFYVDSLGVVQDLIVRVFGARFQ